MKLSEVQKWFSEVITHPLALDQTIQVEGIEKIAPLHIAPSPYLKPHERIEIYSQQYWWRITKILQEHYPLITSLFGRDAFTNQLAIPYFTKHKPPTWNINLLGESFPAWLEENYHESDRALVISSAEVDFGYVYSFLCEDVSYKELSLDEKMTFHPSMRLYKMNYDLFPFRREIIKQEPDFWLDNPFPTLHKGRNFYFVFYRNPKQELVWTEISEAEYTFLEMFRKPMSLNELCSILDTHKFSHEAEKNLSQWIRSWTQRPLLVPAKLLSKPS